MDGQDTGEVGFWRSLDLLESGLSWSRDFAGFRIFVKSGFGIWLSRDFCRIRFFWSEFRVLAKSGFWCGRDFCEVKSFDGFGILVDSEFGVGILVKSGFCEVVFW